ncbi:ATP-binding protein [Roseicyclus elongatus]|uniref:hypothetical protein n=1 Tax=Roseicyclus elongatus TaxID=159346 RepID=UPI0012EB88C0|nr:hypothetical protein [Roseibacterium elongatum]
MDVFHFPRPELAASIVKQMTPDPIFGALSGLHLAAPRRTGKSTFLRRDLVPAVLEADKFPIVVDLWEDRSRDPSDILRRRIGQAIEDLKGSAEKAIDRSRLRRISAPGFSVALADLEPFSGTIPEGLERIGAGVGRDVVLVVDEAQQALVSEGGMDAMFALKAARDVMNIRADGPRLFLIMTGSHRSKLAELVISARAPFYGGSVQDFPVLGESFVRTVLEQLAAAQNVSIPIDEGVAAFEILMHRPEAFMQAVRDEIFEAALSGEKLDLRARAEAVRAALWGNLEAELDGLSGIQRALFEALMDGGEGFSPFSKPALEDVARRARAKSVSKSAVQQAMKSLVEKELVWQPGAGRYAVDNQDMLDMHRRQKSQAS